MGFDRYTTAHFRECATAEFHRLWNADKSGSGRDMDRGLQWLDLYFCEPFALCANQTEEQLNEWGWKPERFAAAAYDAALSASWND